MLPLCLIVQSQTWPTWLLSTSATSWIRPLSGCAFSFQTAGPPQPHGGPAAAGAPAAAPVGARRAALGWADRAGGGGSDGCERQVQGGECESGESGASL